MTPTAAQRRRLLWRAPALAAWAWHGRAQAAAVSVLDHGADPSGQRDSSAAFGRAIEAASLVRVPKGRYLLGDVRLRDGLQLQGDGPDSVLLQRSGSQYALWCDSGSADPADNLRGLRISDLQLRGSTELDGFSEHCHLLNLNGVSDCSVERVQFSAFRGDGLYLGSSNTYGLQRHNLGVTVRDCGFDGVNHGNRNAISVIDCDGLEVLNCSFRRVARDNMPGAIDVEPDAHDFHVVRNIRIRGNRFTDIGGNVAAVSLVVQTALAQPAEHIVVEGNRFDGARRLAFCFLQRGAVAAAAWPRSLAALDNEVGAGVERPFHLEGVRDVTIARNRFGASPRCALVGYDAPALPVYDLVVSDNRFDHTGRRDSCALRTYDLHRARFERNDWLDCGNAGPGAAAVELGRGDASGLVFQDNRFAAPDGLMRYAVRRTAGHRSGDAGSRFTGNRLDPGLQQQLPAPGPWR